MYLENAAFTRPHETVVDAMQPYHDTYYRNPSAAFVEQEATAVGNARQAVTELLNNAPDTVVLPGGESEADDLAQRDTITPARNQHKVPMCDDCEYVKDQLGQLLVEGRR